jgi:hypothetical protein
MDCMDCHNRPSHPFAPTADRAIDAAMAATIIPRTLPYIRREATEAVKATYPTQAAAAEAIAARLRKFYQDQYPQIYAGRRAEVDSAISGTTYAYTTNVFPEMHVTFGTYLNNLGHMFAPGCFRCHDDAHTSADGKVISQDCTLCHELVQ